MNCFSRWSLIFCIIISFFLLFCFFFFFNDTATTEIYTLSLHDALPIPPVMATASGRLALVSARRGRTRRARPHRPQPDPARRPRSRPRARRRLRLRPERPLTHVLREPQQRPPTRLRRHPRKGPGAACPRSAAHFRPVGRRPRASATATDGGAPRRLRESAPAPGHPEPRPPWDFRRGAAPAPRCARDPRHPEGSRQTHRR